MIYLHRNGFNSFYWMLNIDGSYRKLTTDESSVHESKKKFTPERKYPK